MVEEEEEEGFHSAFPSAVVQPWVQLHAAGSDWLQEEEEEKEENFHSAFPFAVDVQECPRCYGGSSPSGKQQQRRHPVTE